MAVIKNSKTGMWEVRTYYKDLTGARKQKTKRGFEKKSEALEWERNFKLKDNQSISMNFKDFVEIYLQNIEPRIKKNTFLTKKHIIETKILPYFAKKKLDDIKPADILRWQNEIMKLKKDNGTPYSKCYLKTIHNQLSVILNHAVNMYGLKDNVARKAGTMGREDNKEMEFWTQEEFQAFLECVADKPISYYAFEILYWTGIRLGELLALTPEDFDFEKKAEKIIGVMEVIGMDVARLKEYPTDMLGQVFEVKDMEYFVGVKVFNRVLDKLRARMENLERCEVFDRIYEEGVREKKVEKERMM